MLCMLKYESICGFQVTFALSECCSCIINDLTPLKNNNICKDNFLKIPRRQQQLSNNCDTERNTQ